MYETASFSPLESTELDVVTRVPLEFSLASISSPTKIGDYFSQHSGELIEKGKIFTEILGHSSYNPRHDDKNVKIHVGNARKLMRDRDPLSEIYPVNGTGGYIHFPRLPLNTTVRIPQLFIDDQTIEGLNSAVQPLAVSCNEVAVNSKNSLVPRFSHQEMIMLMKLMTEYPRSTEMSGVISDESWGSCENIATITREIYLRLQKKLKQTPYRIERDFVRGKTRVPTRFQLVAN